jgi:hypothetical protein
MSCCVDPLAYYGHARGSWCHLLADTSEELHAFAQQLGLRRAWCQHEGTDLEHYRLRWDQRRAALAAGARNAGPREFARVMRDRQIRAGAY